MCVYEIFRELSARPEPFSRTTVKTLWTRPHLARQMLSFHLNQETDLASRRFEQIDAVVNWLDAQVGLSGKSICDLGCGPGLYSQRFADKGAKVTGVDFSAHSLDYAREHSTASIQYLEADYLLDELPGGFDLATLIYTDLGVLPFEQREVLLKKIRQMLNPGGLFVFDVAGVGLLANKQEATAIEYRLMGGFWSAGDYVGVQRSYVYPQERVTLDRFNIVEPDESWEIFNWCQYFTPEAIEAELEKAGFSIEKMAGGLSGEPLDSESDFIGILARAV